MATNIMVFVHGMHTTAEPTDPLPKYEQIWDQLTRARPELNGLITERVLTEWGQPLTGVPARDDQRITAAQRRIVELLDRDVAQGAGESGDHFIVDWHWLWPVRTILDRFIRQPVIQRGFTDAAYYMSPDGEARVREAVYASVLGALQPFSSTPDVRLHIVAESLGVTVAHDFLFALFNQDPSYVPGYSTQVPPGSAVTELTQWRARAAAGDLVLGSFVAVASQLPLFLLRKQALVDLFAANTPAKDVRIDPAPLGLTDSQIRWRLFYDVDDLLAYPTRHLYSPRHHIEEIQVESADRPDKAHLVYWERDDVIKPAADLIADRSV